MYLKTFKIMHRQYAQTILWAEHWGPDEDFDMQYVLVLFTKLRFWSVSKYVYRIQNMAFRVCPAGIRSWHIFVIGLTKSSNFLCSAQGICCILYFLKMAYLQFHKNDSHSIVNWQRFISRAWRRLEFYLVINRIHQLVHFSTIYK